MTEYNIFKQVVLPLYNILPQDLLRMVASFLPNPYQVRYGYVLDEFKYLYNGSNTQEECMITKYALIHQPYYISLFYMNDYDQVLEEMTGEEHSNLNFLIKLPNF